MAAATSKPLHKKLLVSLAMLVLGLLLVEGAVRLRQWSRYGIAQRSFYSMSEDPITGLMIPTPNTRVGPIEINADGFRGPLVETPKPDGRVRLAFLGGSTTFCAEASSLEATWPALVTAELARRHPGVSFDCLNAGGAGYSTAESLANLERRVAPLEPDLIVVYHSTNDLTQDTRRLAVSRGIYRQIEYENDVIGEWWLTWHLMTKNLAARGAEAHDTLDFEPRELSRDFDQRLDALLTRAQEVAEVTAVCTFSHRARRDQGPEEQRAACDSSLLYMPFMSVAGLLDGFDEYNRVIRDVAARRGCVLVGGEDSIPGDATHFNDSVHLRDPGCALQARRVVDALEAAPAFRALVQHSSGVQGE